MAIVRLGCASELRRDQVAAVLVGTSIRRYLLPLRGPDQHGERVELLLHQRTEIIGLV